MKIIFFFVAITLLFTVDASEDLEIYPGINFAISPKQVRSPKNPNSLYSTFLEQNWLPQFPLQSIPIGGYDRTRKKDQEYIYSIPERLREFQQIINSHRNQFKRERDKNYYNRNDRLTQAEDIYEAYKSLQNADERYDRYQLRYPSTQQILDDVRPYPHDDDFTFHDDDVEEFERNGDGNGDRKNEEASGKGELQYEKVSDDVSEFAYTPLNPRFFENAPYTESRTPQQIEEDYVESNGNNEYSDASSTNEEKIFVKPRYDDVFTLQHPSNDRQTLEQHTDNAVEVVAVKPHFQDKDTAGVYIIAVVAGISAAATVGLIAFGIGWYNLQKHVKNASDVEYPAYGVTGPNKDVSPSGDRRLAQSAQMYHYQHQKQQIIAMESRATATDRHGSLSEADSDEENEEGDYTVYECPGLAPTGEMEVKNPLFQDDPTPAQTPQVQTNGENVQKK